MEDRRCTRLIRPEEDGSFFACVPEYPGCFATGDTPLDALANLEEVILEWVDACLSLGQDIPEFDDMSMDSMGGR